MTYHKFLANDINRIAQQAVGFERFFDLFEDTFEKSTFPHHNIVKTDENNYLVELAVAGFTEQDISIEIQNNTLIIKSLENTDPDMREYLHRGIAKRAFIKNIRLTDTVEVKGATLQNGILTVELVNIVPEEKKPKKIPINYIGKKQLLTE